MEKVSRREVFGEVLGTFILVFFGLGSVAVEVATPVTLGLPVIALIWGAAVALAIQVAGPMSGAHLNCSITLAFACWRGFSWRKVPAYFGAQFLGAILAALAVYFFFRGAIGDFEAAQGIVRGQPGSEATAKIFGEYFGEASLLKAMIWEFTGTFFLAFGVFFFIEASRRWKLEKWLPVMIGLWLSVLIYFVAPVTQAGFNPARDLGPRIVSAMLGWGSWVFEANGSGWFWVYVVGPVLGAVLGGAMIRSGSHLFRKMMIVILGAAFLWFAVVRLTSSRRAIEIEYSSKEKIYGSRETIRIGTFNIAHGRGADVGASNWEGGSAEERRERLIVIAQFLKQQDLDVIVLNEVDFNSSWSKGVDQAQVIANHTGMLAVLRQRNYDSGLPFVSWEFGNAILTRHRMREAELISYPAVKWWEPFFFGKKEGAKATISALEREPFEIIAVHLETRNAEVRKESLKRLLDAASDRTVLAGDFNSSFSGKSDTAIDDVHADGRWQAAGGWGNEGAFLSYPDHEPKRRIDWIFVPKSWEQVSAEVKITGLSDHALLISEWRWVDKR